MLIDPARQFADTLATLPARERRDEVACATIETGGTYPFAAPARPLLVIDLLGIRTTGTTEDEAIQNWITAAQGPRPGIRATDGRPDCPYNGQGLAPCSAPDLTAA